MLYFKKLVKYFFIVSISILILFLFIPNYEDVIGFNVNVKSVNSLENLLEVQAFEQNYNSKITVIKDNVVYQHYKSDIKIVILDDIEKLNFAVSTITTCHSFTMCRGSKETIKVTNGQDVLISGKNELFLNLDFINNTIYNFSLVFPTYLSAMNRNISIEKVNKENFANIQKQFSRDQLETEPAYFVPVLNPTTFKQEFEIKNNSLNDISSLALKCDFLDLKNNSTQTTEEIFLETTLKRDGVIKVPNPVYKKYTLEKDRFFPLFCGIVKVKVSESI